MFKDCIPQVENNRDTKKNSKQIIYIYILKIIYSTRFLSRDPRVSKAYNVNSFLIDDLMFLAILLVQFDQIFQPATFRALLLDLLLEILVHLLHNLLKLHSYNRCTDSIRIERS